MYFLLSVPSTNDHQNVPVICWEATIYLNWLCDRIILIFVLILPPYSPLIAAASGCAVWGVGLFGRSPAEIVGSNPTGGMDVCLLWVLGVVRWRPLRRIDHSSRGVLWTVARRGVWSRNLENEEAKARYRAVKILVQPQWVVTPRKQTNRQVTYLLTPCSTVLLEKLTGSAASQEIPRIFGTPSFITVLTSARHLSLSWANSIQSPQPPPTSWRSILILSSHLRLRLPSGLFPSSFPTRILCIPLPCPVRQTNNI